MKASNKIILAFGLAACLGMTFSAVGQADPDKTAAGQEQIAPDDNGAAAQNPAQQTSADAPTQQNQGTETAEPPKTDVDQAQSAPDDNGAAAQNPAQQASADAPTQQNQGTETTEPPKTDVDQAQSAPADNGAAAQNPAQQAAAEIMTDPSAMPDYDLSLFSHKFHVSQAGFGCADCHNSVFQQAGGSAKAAGDFNMESFAQGKYCGSCHDGSTAFSVKEQDSCTKCHGSDMKPPKSIVFEKPVKAVVFDHAMHAEQFGLPCSNCHEGVFKMKLGSSEEQPEQFTMDAIYKGKYCGACHNGSLAFDAKTRCTKCHIGVKGYNRMFGEKKEAEGKSGH